MEGWLVVRKGLLMVSGGGILLSLVYLAETFRYSRGSLAQPGPGLYPLLIAALLVLSSVGVGLAALTDGAKASVAWPHGAGLQRTLAILLASLAYAVLLPSVGHPIAGILVVLVVLRVMGVTNWLMAGALALGMALGSYYLFQAVFGVPLPAGLSFR